MCGITGLWNLDGKPIDPSQIQSATTLLRHRGPDDEGYLLVDTAKGQVLHCGGNDTITALDLPRIENAVGKSFNLSFGFRRLSILDLSPAGHQPMAGADGQCWIIFNGEIYNFLELRSELSGYGHRFRTGSDTEVILAAYRQWGVECLSRFNGMWALAIWDNRLRRLFCARDRLGIKPFYYFRNNDTFAFASEIKALLHLPGIPRLANDAIIYDYLYHGYLDHTEETCFAGIKQLPPAHYLTECDGHLQINRYWDLDPQRREPVSDEATYVRKFYELFEDAVRIHLRSDVAIGTCLSGGLDSSAIVCVANKLLFTDGVANPEVVGERQKTFSSCFDDERFDERRYIEQVLAATVAEPNYTFPSGAQLPEILPRLIWHQDEPFLSTSIYAQWRVMATAAERGVKVLLDGQGGDELLAGYPGYFSCYWASLMQQRRLAELWKEVSAYRRLHGVSLTRIGLRLARRYAPTALSSVVDRERRGADLGLSREFLRRNHRGVDDLRTIYDRDPFAAELYALLTRFSLPQLLHYEDRNSMAFSIEARVPFLDYRLIEYTFALPPDQKIKGGWTKAILRAALRDILPEPVRMRTDKMGFVTPERVWLVGELNEWIREIALSTTFRERGCFNVAEIVEAFGNHAVGKRNLPSQAWRWINLELWFRRMIDA